MTEFTGKKIKPDYIVSKERSPTDVSAENVFNYDALVNGTHFNRKAFALVILSSALSEIIKQDSRNMEYSAYDITVDAINKIGCHLDTSFTRIAESSNYEVFKPELSAEIASLIQKAGIAKVEPNPSNVVHFIKPKDLAINFMTRLVELVIDSITMVKNENVLNEKLKMTDIGYACHYTEIEFKQDNNVWTYYVDHIDIEPDWTFLINNNVKIQLSKDAVWIHALFKELAIGIAYKAAVDFHIEQAAKKPDALRKAKLLADLLGCDYKQYLIITHDFDELVEWRRIEHPNKDDNALFALTVREEFVATDKQLSEIVKILQNESQSQAVQGDQ